MAALWAEISQIEVSRDRRGKARRTLRLVSLAAMRKSTSEVLILDLSTTGLMIETNAELAVDETIEVELPHAGAVMARVVWKREAYFGCEFLTPASVAAVSAALLSSVPQQPRHFSTPDRPKGVLDYASAPAEPIMKTASPLVTTISLALVLIVVVIFMGALLTLPFSAGQFGR